MQPSILWQHYSDFAEARGFLVLQILQKFTQIKGKNVLDIGCGDGGTSYIFDKVGANVNAIDIKDKLKYKNSSISFKIMSANNLKFSNQQFDIVIIQDVLEHLTDVERVLSEVKRVIKANGFFFLSTPNRISPLNFISDPHWNLPLVSILPRNGVKFYVKYLFHRDQRDRNDWAELKSLFYLNKLLVRNSFNFRFTNSQVAELMFKYPSSVVCNTLHLKIIAYLKNTQIEKLVYRIVNDKYGLFNYFVNPTWYIVGWLQ